MFIRGKVYSPLISLTHLSPLLQIPWPYFQSPWSSSISLAAFHLSSFPFPCDLFTSSSSMAVATILTCPSIMMFFEDFSVPSLPCLVHGSLLGWAPTFFLFYTFSSISPLLSYSTSNSAWPQVVVKEVNCCSRASSFPYSSGERTSLSLLRLCSSCTPSSHAIPSHLLWGCFYILSSPLQTLSFFLLPQTLYTSNILNILRC